LNNQDIYKDLYPTFSDEEKEKIHVLFKDHNTLEDVKKKLEKIVFQFIPPTPEEFLDPKNKWLPIEYINGLYPYIKQDFCACMRVENPYSIISMYGCIRSGKSVLARLCVMYTLIYVNYLRDPHTYFKINKMSRLCIYLLSFKAEKTNQVYLSPIIDLLSASEMFVREHFENRVYSTGLDTEGRIHFSEASKFGDITFPKCYIVTGKDAGSLVGADIIAGAVSELTFFKEYAVGMTDEEIVQVFTKLFSRIQNTVGFGNFPCWSYIDSSANDSDSPIEKLILDDLKNQKTTFFRHYVLWEIRPHLYPSYSKTGETFPVCVGQGDVPAMLIENREDIKRYPSDLIIEVPIDLYDTFKRKLVDSLKDIAGRPTISENKFISDTSVIPLLWSNSALENVEGIIYADASEPPEELLWNQLKDKYFTKSADGRYQFKRSPQEIRYIGLDNAFAAKGGDVMGFSVIHKEWDRVKQSIMYVVDFSFAIDGKGKGINLEAPACFITDIIKHANAKVYALFTDTFHSEAQKQFLERNHVHVIKQSVDREINPYQYFYTCLINERIKSGKNIFLKNNLNSLVRTRGKDDRKEKIDHVKGITDNHYKWDFDSSKCGTNAKDVSDSLCQAITGAYSHEYVSMTDYETENKRFSSKPEDIEHFTRDAYNRINRIKPIKDTNNSGIDGKLKSFMGMDIK